MAEKNEKLMPRGLIPSSPGGFGRRQKVHGSGKEGAARSIPALAVRLVLLGE